MENVKKPLPREFYLRDANTVAPALLGKLLVHRAGEGVASGVIVEVESYAGPADKGAHSYGNRRSERTEIQFGPGGFAYVYLIYGMHACFNVVVNVEDKPEVVLIRALEPVDGVPLMARRRGTEDRLALCSGPGKLCEALGITRAHNGFDLCGGELFLEDGPPVERERIMVSPRIHIDYAEECTDYPWRYFLRDNPHVSRVEKRYRLLERPL